MFYPVKPFCGAAYKWLRRGKLALYRLYSNRAFPLISAFLSNLSVLSGKKHRIYKSRCLTKVRINRMNPKFKTDLIFRCFQFGILNLGFGILHP